MDTRYVSYAWTADGDAERCLVRRKRFVDEECYHCFKPINELGIELTAPDGDVYSLHEACAYEGCAGYDQEVIKTAQLVLEEAM